MNIIKVILDTNIYDKLASCAVTIDMVSDHVRKRNIAIIVTRTILNELHRSPFKGIPNWFNVVMRPESVFLLDYSLLDEDVMGEGKVYEYHKGSSRYYKDALIADLADAECDLLVSEDHRLRKRLSEISRNCKTMSFNEFQDWLMCL